MRAVMALIVALGATVQASQSDPRALLSRAIASFAEGRVVQAVAEFDELVRLVPAQAPYLWQRGIAQYYAGRFGECRRQFESHRAVNPDDVENAVWHFLCVARSESVAAAGAALLPVGPDPRTPMREIYQLFRGALGADDVLAAAGRDPAAQFYAHLYVGLYAEAIGDRPRAVAELKLAADARYAAAGGYMHMVARVHRALLHDAR